MDGEENLTEEALGFADISRRWEVDAVQTKPVARKEVWKGERWKVVEKRQTLHHTARQDSLLRIDLRLSDLGRDGRQGR